METPWDLRWTLHAGRLATFKQIYSTAYPIHDRSKSVRLDGLHAAEVEAGRARYAFGGKSTKLPSATHATHATPCQAGQLECSVAGGRPTARVPSLALGPTGRVGGSRPAGLGLGFGLGLDWKASKF